MWAKRLLPSSLSRFVKKPNVDESDASKAPETSTAVPEPEIPRARSLTPRARRNDASPGGRGQGDTDQRRAPAACPRAFKMISFKTPCACEACDPFQEVTGRRLPTALPTFGRSESSKTLPTFGRSASASSLQRSGSARSLSPRRPREDAEVREPVACDWKSLYSLVGSLGLLQSQVLRKLRDDQEEQLLLQGSSQTTASSPLSVNSGCGYQTKKDEKEMLEQKETPSPRGARQRRAPRERSAPASARASRAAVKVAPETSPANSEAKKSVRPKSAAPKSREPVPSQAPKAKAKAKGKSKAKAKAKTKPSEDNEEPVESPTAKLAHQIMWSPEGDEIPLQSCQKVEELLQHLHSSVANPLCQHFRLRYDFLLEQHCQERKAGVARRAPKVVNGEERYLTTVRLRLRKHPVKGDPQKEFIGRGAMMAVLLHELAHLRYMNHGQEFMLLLREIFAEAKKREIFDPELVNELPSCRPWENLIYQTGGDIDVESLMKVFEPDSSSCATPRNASPVRARPTKVGQVEAETAETASTKAMEKGRLPPPPQFGEPRSSGASTATPSGRDSLNTMPSRSPESTEVKEAEIVAETVTDLDESPSKARKSRMLRPKKT